MMSSEIGFSFVPKRQGEFEMLRTQAVDAARQSKVSQRALAPVAPLPVVMTAQPMPAAQQTPFPVALFPVEDPWYKKPSVIGGIAAGVLVLGLGGYMVARR